MEIQLFNVTRAKGIRNQNRGYTFQILCIARYQTKSHDAILGLQFHYLSKLEKIFNVVSE